MSHSIFGASLTGYTDDTDLTAITVGTIFFVKGGTPGWQIDGVRFWPGAAVTGAVAMLFSLNPTTFITAKQMTGSATAHAWNTITFDAPADLVQWPGGKYYVAAVYYPSGGYAFKAHVFDVDHGGPVIGEIPSPDEANLLAAANDEVTSLGIGNGVFHAGSISTPLAPGALSWSSFNATHYGVDVIVTNPSEMPAPTDPPANTVAPAVTGTATVGQTLTCSHGTWTQFPTSYAFQWQRAGVNITGAISSTYVPVDADAGNAVRCVVTATNGIGSASQASNAVTVVAAIQNTSGGNTQAFVGEAGVWREITFAAVNRQRLNQFYPQDYGAACDGETDDTLALRACIADAVQAGLNDGSNYAEVMLSAGGGYLLATAPVVGGATGGNAQLPLPVIPEADMKFTLVFRGSANASTWNHWNQAMGQSNGARLITTMTNPTPDGTYSVASVIGGPTANFAGLGIPSLYSNMLVVVDGVQIVAPQNPGFMGLDLFHVAQADVRSYSAQANARSSVLSGALPTNDQGVGLRLPLINNNDNVTVGSVSVMGFYYGCNLVDHLAAVRMGFIYGHSALYAQIGGGAYHGASILNLSIEAHTTLIEVIQSETNSKFPLFVAMLNTETSGGGVNFIDPNSALRGVVNFTNNAGAAPTKTGATHLTVNDLFAV